jgi:hypothetical protein
LKLQNITQRFLEKPVRSLTISADFPTPDSPTIEILKTPFLFSPKSDDLELREMISFSPIAVFRLTSFFGGSIMLEIKLETYKRGELTMLGEALARRFPES